MSSACRGLIFTKNSVQLVLTRRTNAVSIQDAVPPDRLPRGSIQHGTHHLVKGLVGVTAQCALSVFIDEASAKTSRETWLMLLDPKA